MKFVHAGVVLDLLLPLGFAGLLPRRVWRHRGFIGNGNILKSRQLEFGSRERLAFQMLLNGLAPLIEQTFGGFTKILQQMPAIRDLLRLRSPARRGVSVG